MAIVFISCSRCTTHAEAEGNFRYFLDHRARWAPKAAGSWGTFGRKDCGQARDDAGCGVGTIASP